MKVDIDPALFKGLGQFIVGAWANPQVRMFVAGQGISQAHIDEVKSIMAQLEEGG